MGLNTTVVIYNDALDSIKNDKNFGKNLYDAIMENHSSNETESFFTVFGRGFQDAGIVVEQHHSSYDVLVKVSGNTGVIVKEEG